MKVTVIWFVLLVVVQMAAGMKRKRVKVNDKYSLVPEVPPSDTSVESNPSPSDEGIRAMVESNPSPHIVGGDDAVAGQFPYYVMMTIKSRGSYYFRCGGSLISDRWVVTAAHCTEGYTSNRRRRRIRLFLGAVELVVDSQRERRVSNVISHSGYNGYTLNDDISLMELSELADLTDDRVDVVALPPIGTTDTYAGEDARLIGFGRLYYNGPLPSTLQSVVIPVLSNAECTSIVGWNVPDGMICGDDSYTESTCNGDSGGPMVLESSGELIGVVSWGYSCQVHGYPGGRTRITHYRDWINSNTGI